MKKGFCDFLAEEEGGSSIEYALLVSAIAGIIAATVFYFGSTVQNRLYNPLYTTMQSHW